MIVSTKGRYALRVMVELPSLGFSTILFGSN